MSLRCSRTATKVAAQLTQADEITLLRVGTLNAGLRDAAHYHLHRRPPAEERDDRPRHLHVPSHQSGWAPEVAVDSKKALDCTSSSLSFVPHVLHTTTLMCPSSSPSASAPIGLEQHAYRVLVTDEAFDREQSTVPSSAPPAESCVSLPWREARALCLLAVEALAVAQTLSALQQQQRSTMSARTLERLVCLSVQRCAVEDLSATVLTQLFSLRVSDSRLSSLADDALSSTSASAATDRAAIPTEELHAAVISSETSESRQGATLSPPQTESATALIQPQTESGTSSLRPQNRSAAAHTDTLVIPYQENPASRASTTTIPPTHHGPTASTVVIPSPESTGRASDLSALSTLHSLSLEGMDQIVQVSALGSVHSLCLDEMHGVVDVSALGTVHALTLSRMDHVAELSALGSVHTLCLYDVPAAAAELSALGTVHTLRISEMDVADASALGTVHTLDLFRVHELADVSALASVHTLQLDASSLDEVSALAAVHTLELCELRLRDVSALGTVHTLRIFGAPLVREVSALARVHSLELCNLPLVEDVSALATVRSLSLVSLPALADVSALGAVRRLRLQELPLVCDVSRLGSVHELDLCRLPLLEEVSALRTVHRLRLRSLPAVEDLSALGTVHTLDLWALPRVLDVSALGTVNSLRLGSLGVQVDPTTLSTVQCLRIAPPEKRASTRSKRSFYVSFEPDP
eukprot:CAMPEP_0177635796 /NCGR_PEP_ID=MMETSP0447-20121125/4097_1 /TAXON_ID=0 /ORGANISM="Stygamoeba regulata, Strain BSH-02190019" /LENGTH=696 /DNA_ID=CAMNT_0019137617 /DNA_START=609 /DNA_END=2701 /DNA_ORIENTATION=+